MEEYRRLCVEVQVVWSTLPLVPCSPCSICQTAVERCLSTLRTSHHLWIVQQVWPLPSVSSGRRMQQLPQVWEQVHGRGWRGQEGSAKTTGQLLLLCQHPPLLLPIPLRPMRQDHRRVQPATAMWDMCQGSDSRHTANSPISVCLLTKK
jgi:hypothetical protein